MEDNKIRIGITQGDINGVGYEVILKTFSDPTMLELCTPIIYGSPKVAAYHRKGPDEDPGTPAVPLSLKKIKKVLSIIPFFFKASTIAPIPLSIQETIAL